MQKVTAFLLIPGLLISICSFTNTEKETIKWLTIQQMQVAYLKDPKPILIDVYTSWCGWCKVMDRVTYRNSKVANYINNHFYAIKLDAESKDSFIWAGKKYEFNAGTNVNTLAVFLLNGQMSFPSTVFLATEDASPAPLAGYLKPLEIEPPLKFFGEGIFKEYTFSEFIKSFKSTW